MPTGQYERKNLAKRFVEKVKTGPGCWEWQGAIGTHGYGRIGHKNKIMQAHRVSFELFNARLIYDWAWVLHSCDNKKCVNPKHLFLGDRQANINDCVEKKRHIFGDKSALTKLTPEQISDIRRMWDSKEISQRQIGELFNTGQSNISYIVNLKSRKNG